MLDSVSGIILAGGSSSRLGQNKALIQVAGIPLIERVARRLHSIVTDIELVTHTPEQFAFLGLPMARDIHPGIGTLGGLHAGLETMHTEYGLVVGCDMPFLNPDLLRYMASLKNGYDIVMPRVGEYYEPLHAIYAKRCLPTIERGILAGERRIRRACAGLHIRYVEKDQITLYDPHRLSFFNINTPDDLRKMDELLRA